MASDDFRVRPNENAVTTLCAEDREAFHRLLLDPPPPNEEPMRAARRHEALFDGRRPAACP
jgi:hypothetical protein